MRSGAPRGSFARPSLSTLLVVLGILAMAPLALSGDRFLLHVLIITMIWGVVAVAWDLVLGYGGVFSWGQMAFFVLGAYGAGMLTLVTAASPLLGLLAGATGAGVVALILGWPTLRLPGVQVGLVTFAMHLTLGPLIQLGKDWGTGGYLGLLGVPPLAVGGYTFDPLNLGPWYYVAWFLLGLSSLLIFTFLRSTYGLALMATRDAEPFAQSLGISSYRLKLAVFIGSAALTGLAGAFYAQYTSSVSPRLLGLDIFVTLTAMLVVGGIGRFPGAIIGAIAVSVVTEVLRPLEQVRLVLFGALVIVAVLAMPGGVMGILEAGRSGIRLLLRGANKVPRASPPIESDLDRRTGPEK